MDWRRDVNFEGRYYTNNGTLVAVHPAKAQWYSNWEGHEIFDSERKQQPLEMDLPLRMWWDDKGMCLVVQGTFSNVNDYNLKTQVNPQSMDNNVDVDGCEDCRKWKEGR